MAGEPEIAGIYCRLSDARSGDTTKVDEQERICRELAARRGWTVPDHLVWKDNNKSAWRTDRKRPGWEAMVAALQNGIIRNVVVYHGDRLVRQPYDLNLLIKLVDGFGITIASPTGDRDLDNYDDRFVLRILVDVACKESDDTSRRKRAGFRRMARAGIAPAAGSRWGRGFGYDTSGRLPVPAEADAIREAARRVLAGELLTAVAADLTARGIRSVSGKPMDWHTLQRILLRPRIAGLMNSGEPGSWEPILDRDTWEMTRATLTARAVSRPAAENRRYLLSGIAECSECHGKMQRHATGRHGNVSVGYGCVTPGCRKVHRDMEHLDAYVTRRVVNRLRRPEVAQALAAIDADPAGMQIAQLEMRRAEAKATIETLADHPGADLALLITSLASFDTRIAELRAGTEADALARIRADHEGITEAEFLALPLQVRRSLVAACFRVTVLPASKRGPGFRTEDVSLVPV